MSPLESPSPGPCGDSTESGIVATSAYGSARPTRPAGRRLTPRVTFCRLRHTRQQHRPQTCALRSCIVPSRACGVDGARAAGVLRRTPSLRQRAASGQVSSETFPRGRRGDSTEMCRPAERTPGDEGDAQGVHPAGGSAGGAREWQAAEWHRRGRPSRNAPAPQDASDDSGKSSGHAPTRPGAHGDSRRFTSDAAGAAFS